MKHVSTRHNNLVFLDPIYDGHDFANYSRTHWFMGNTTYTSNPTLPAAINATKF